MRTTSRECLLGGDIAAVIFGVDGVTVDCTRAAATAWKAALDPFLRSHAAACEICCRWYDTVADYRRHMHGRSRIDGLRAFLGARDILLSYDDIRGLACHQEEVLLAEVARQGVPCFPSTVSAVTALRRQGLRTAAVCAQRYATELLTRAGIADLFDLRLDGVDTPWTEPADHSGLYREATLRLGVSPARTAVVEESPVGIQAGRRCGFSLLIGVDRAERCIPTGRHDAALRGCGAHVVISDLADLRLREPVV